MHQILLIQDLRGRRPEYYIAYILKFNHAKKAWAGFFSDVIACDTDFFGYDVLGFMTLAYYYDFTVKADYIFVIITQITVQEENVQKGGINSCSYFSKC